MRDLPQIIDYDKEKLAYALANAIKERDEAIADYQRVCKERDEAREALEFRRAKAFFQKIGKWEEAVK